MGEIWSIQFIEVLFGHWHPHLKTTMSHLGKSSPFSAIKTTEEFESTVKSWTPSYWYRKSTLDYFITISDRESNFEKILFNYVRGEAERIFKYQFWQGLQETAGACRWLQVVAGDSRWLQRTARDCMSVQSNLGEGESRWLQEIVTYENVINDLCHMWSDSPSYSEKSTIFSFRSVAFFSTTLFINHQSSSSNCRAAQCMIFHMPSKWSDFLI